MTYIITLPVGYKPVLKHGDHDQSSHGSWATGIMNDLLTLGSFDEESEYEGAMSTYSERYGVDREGKIVGVTEAEHYAIDDYSQNGYMKINDFLRRGSTPPPLTTERAIFYIQNDSDMYVEALDEYAEANGLERGWDLDPPNKTAIEDAVRQYAESGNERITDFHNENVSYATENIQKSVEALDSLIDKSPSLFGSNTLFRVFDNKVLDGLKEGDIMTDKGFLSTTRIDVTREPNSSARTWMGAIDETPDTIGVILPNESKSGKGLAVDIYRTVVDDTSPASDTEKEILLPRSTPLKFLGYKTDVGTEAQVALFQRMDK
jgi:hypothetical protein